MWDFHWWYLIIVTLVAWLGLSTQVLRSYEFAIVERFGAYVKTTGSGLKFYLAGIYKLTVYDSLVQQFEFPGEPEKVVRDDSAPIDESKGQVRAIRINHPPAEQALFFHDPPTQDEIENGLPSLTYEDLEREFPGRFKALEQDSFQKRIASEVNGPIALRIRQDKAFQFYTTIGSIEEAKKRLFDDVVSTLQSVLGRMTLAESMRAKSAVDKILQRRLQKLVGEEKLDSDKKEAADQQTDAIQPLEDHGAPWGIVIESVSIKNLNPGKRVNISLAEAAASIEDRKRKIADGEAEAQVIRDTGKAKAEAILEEGKAEAAATKAAAEAFQDPNAIIARQLDVLETGFENANLIISGEAIGLAATAAKLLEQKSK